MDEFLNMILRGQGGMGAGMQAPDMHRSMQMAPTAGLHGGLVQSPNPDILGATRGAAPNVGDAPAGEPDAFMAMLQNPAFQDMLKQMGQQQQPQLPGGGVGHMDISRFLQSFAPPTVDASLLGRSR